MNITKIMASSALALAISANAMASTKQENTFNYVVERFADIEVLRYKVPGFEERVPKKVDKKELFERMEKDNAISRARNRK